MTWYNHSPGGKKAKPLEFSQDQVDFIRSLPPPTFSERRQRICIIISSVAQDAFDRNRHASPQVDRRTPDWTPRFSYPGLPISSLFSLSPTTTLHQNIKMDASPHTFSSECSRHWQCGTHLVAGGSHDGGQSETSVVGQQVGSEDRSPQPESMPAGGSDSGGQRGKVGIDGRKVGQRYSHRTQTLGSLWEVGPEVERVHPTQSVPSIPPSGEPDST